MGCLTEYLLRVIRSTTATPPASVVAALSYLQKPEEALSLLRESSGEKQHWRLMFRCAAKQSKLFRLSSQKFGSLMTNGREDTGGCFFMNKEGLVSDNYFTWNCFTESASHCERNHNVEKQWHCVPENHVSSPHRMDEQTPRARDFSTRLSLSVPVNVTKISALRLNQMWAEPRQEVVWNCLDCFIFLSTFLLFIHLIHICEFSCQQKMLNQIFTNINNLYLSPAFKK